MLIRLFIILIILSVSACKENGSEQSATSTLTETQEYSSSTEIQGQTAAGLKGTDDNTSTLTETQEYSSSTEIQGQTAAGLKGTDDNANGIRDDIDQLIEQKFSYTPSVKRAAEQEARALQQFMEAKTKEAAIKGAEQIARATRCTFKILSDPIRDYEKRQALSKELEAWTTNTKERLSHYLASSQLISGSYFMQQVEPFCD